VLIPRAPVSRSRIAGAEIATDQTFSDEWRDNSRSDARRADRLDRVVILGDSSRALEPSPSDPLCFTGAFDCEHES